MNENQKHNILIMLNYIILGGFLIALCAIFAEFSGSLPDGSALTVFVATTLLKTVVHFIPKENRTFRYFVSNTFISDILFVSLFAVGDFEGLDIVFLLIGLFCLILLGKNGFLKVEETEAS